MLGGVDFVCKFLEDFSGWVTNESFKVVSFPITGGLLGRGVMKKMICLLFVLVLVCSLFISCSSSFTSYNRTEMLPQFSVGWTDLDRDQYEFIGNVTGSSAFTVEGDESDVYFFTGILDIENIENATRYDSVNAALNRAVYEMTLKSKELNANMLILPSYSVESKTHHIQGLFKKISVTTEVTVSVSAVAVKLVDNKGQSLEVY